MPSACVRTCCATCRPWVPEKIDTARFKISVRTNPPIGPGRQQEVLVPAPSSSARS